MPLWEESSALIKIRVNCPTPGVKGNGWRPSGDHRGLQPSTLPLQSNSWLRPPSCRMCIFQDWRGEGLPSNSRPTNNIQKNIIKPLGLFELPLRSYRLRNADVPPCIVQNMPPNTDHAHNKHIWTIICNFSQVQVITPWWWILCDPKHVWVYFNVCLLDFYITLILTSTTVIIECISWLIKVTDNKDARWKTESVHSVGLRYIIKGKNQWYECFLQLSSECSVIPSPI